MNGLFVGLTTLDVIQYVASFPEPDSKIQAEAAWVGAGGPAANAAVTFAQLGGTAYLMSALGSSFAGLAARNDLESYGVKVLDAASGGLCAISSIVVDRTARRTVVSTNAIGFEHLLPLKPPRPRVDVVLSDGHHTSLALPVMAWARDAGIATILDAGSRKPDTDALVARSDYVVASSSFVHASPEATLRDLLRGATRLAAVTDGQAPIMVATRDGATTVPVPEVVAIDTLGAGDVLHGAFAFYLASGQPAESALATAATVAAESCTRRGPRLA